MILVVGHEKLSVEMQRTYEKRMKVIKVPKSGGVCILLDLTLPVSNIQSSRLRTSMRSIVRESTNTKCIHISTGNGSALLLECPL